MSGKERCLEQRIRKSDVQVQIIEKQIRNLSYICEICELTLRFFF